jgi:prepilin-type N-terminal cleavage/methylation domain-containing protein
MQAAGHARKQLTEYSARVLLRKRSSHDRPAFVMQDRQARGFTLIELLVVITIIVILLGFLFPALQGVQDRARKVQAKNDLTQIVTAVNAFYTEYGKYPIATPSDSTFGPGGSPTTNEILFNDLRGLAASTLNPRQIAFISPPDAKDANSPRSGIATGASNVGQYFDPWGKNYAIRIDGDYDNQVDNPYSQNAGSTPKLRNGVIAWSLGKDGAGGSGSPNKNTGNASDDVISWQ